MSAVAAASIALATALLIVACADEHTLGSVAHNCALDPDHAGAHSCACGLRWQPEPAEAYNLN